MSASLRKRRRPIDRTSIEGRPCETANRYYAFGGEKLDLLDRISKTPPPSTSRSRSPPSTTRSRKFAPASLTFRLSTLPGKSSLLDRISPKGYSPQSISFASLRPLSPEPGNYLDVQMDEEEEEQVIRVLDNSRELVYQRDFGSDDRQDREGEPHESWNSSPVKKRKLAHPNQPTDKSTLQTSSTHSQLSLATTAGVDNNPGVRTEYHSTYPTGPAKQLPNPPVTATGHPGVLPPHNAPSIRTRQPSNQTPESSIPIDPEVSACKRLLSSAFSPHELIPLIEEIFTRKDEVEMIGYLNRDAAQAFIDVVHEVCPTVQLRGAA